jgi:hypothetical protein
MQTPIAVAGTAKKACTRATRKDLPPILHTVNGKAVDAIQVGEIAKDSSIGNEIKSSNFGPQALNTEEEEVRQSRG